jgi:lipoate-protein ligase A
LELLWVLELGAWRFDSRKSVLAMNWLLLNSGKCNAAFNMALDEALLDSVSRLCKPVLRFYGWTEAAATFGYFQKFSEVEGATLLRPLIRRPTGGGIVPHDADWTYSMAFPPGHEWHLLAAIESYRRIHEWIQNAFAKLKMETELAPCCKKAVQISRSRGNETHSEKISQSLLTSAPTGQCFAGHEKFDLLWRGRKIAGAAQRRNKLGLLIQGSVQPPPVSLKRVDWENAMAEVARREFGAAGHDLPPDAKLREHAETLARQKYSQNNYNQKR